MAIQNVIGDSFRGATWVSIHNGGGVGWGEVINGGFGMVLTAQEASDVSNPCFSGMSTEFREEEVGHAMRERFCHKNHGKPTLLKAGSGARKTP
jgi:hypothetical protein